MADRDPIYTAHAHELCPDSNATRGNIDVELSSTAATSTLPRRGQPPSGPSRNIPPEIGGR